jgi:hypothetical protein
MVVSCDSVMVFHWEIWESNGGAGISSLESRST